MGVLVLSQYVEAEYATALLGERTEGTGYLLKDTVANVDEFTDAVRRVAAGGSALDPAVVAHARRAASLSTTRWRRSPRASARCSS